MVSLIDAPIYVIALSSESEWKVSKRGNKREKTLVHCINENEETIVDT